ncbi:glycoside hydrolase family 38 C-terminal domain-containing protein [Salinibacterium sp. G-O1]|uniref:alpha-mannosidase n=1 Tax=Salinibacterium sp. G-O1 TaxID=3046208 RepID=UPI0024B970E7|nr:glycoside hydrolase family 38 C-terminal domain-containing protein [Salinibacterium sp. G-O1]MDJ0335548.1 glycoside hydrolase family 38 C-terminal domain-containing protein [Salinibacterium sp. G-O1]
MHDKSALIEARIERFVRERITPAMYRETAQVDIATWDVPDEPVPFAHAREATYRPFAVGEQWGAPWGTTWLHVTGEIPASWDQKGTRPELVVNLSFSTATPGFQAEAIAYSPNGDIIKSLEPLNTYVPLGAAGTAVDLFLEAAANPNVAGNFTFAPTAHGDKATAGKDPLYRLRRLELGLLDVEVWELLQDVWSLGGLMRTLPATLPRRAEIMYALDRMVDAIDPDDIAGTAGAGRAELAGVLAQPAYASAHQLAAVGHAHIDSAWLWPVRETVRKVARTFSNVLALMEEDPDFVFAASSAQQYLWLKEHYPALFERVKAQAHAGRFVPVGGMWVESDTNMPGGEALARQFIHGKRFFMEEFGIEPLEVWLPDSFGYSAALPQIVAAAGSKWFLTQKISWNETNRMPHHTFLWEGIDGTRIFTHFPPVDTYMSELSASELALAQSQYAEKGMAKTSLVPFGWGDGGGGPTREMLAAAARTKDLEGSPQVTLSSPRQFFEKAEAEYSHPPVWTGEMYLELHRGTYTSQANTKLGNRRSEHLLREAELWATTASVLGDDEYPYAALETAWRTVLLQQFHDILPGSSIAWVHQEAERQYAEVAETLNGLIGASLSSIAGAGDVEFAFNAGPFPLDGVPALGGASATATVACESRRDGDDVVLENTLVRVRVDSRGVIVSLFDIVAGRELVPAGAAANVLQLFRDLPNQWDAWDIDESYKQDGQDLLDVVSVTSQGDAVRVEREFGTSRVVQLITLSATTASVDITTTVDWHEREKLLKLSFPLDVHADRAASEIQFGHLYRPTHANTSWDSARFETVAHRWVQVGEPGYGVSVANDSIYGHDIRRSEMADGATATVVRLSLLRAPLFPDPECDQGVHTFVVSIRAGAGIPEAVEEGYRLNLPLRTIRGSGAPAPLIAVDKPGVVVEAVKLADDRSGDVIVRLYEAHGSRTSTTLSTEFGWTSVTETDLLERAIDQSAVSSNTESTVSLSLRPFQLVTLRFSR